MDERFASRSAASVASNDAPRIGERARRRKWVLLFAHQPRER
jgi:hypothetical protein